MRRSTLIKVGTLASVVAAMAVAPMAQAADSAYLRIEGVPGQDAATPATRDAVSVQEYNLGAENDNSPLSATAGGGGGRATFNELSIKKNVDITSPQLFQKLVQGQMIPSMELAVMKGQASGSPVVSMRYCFQNVFLRSQEHSETAGDSAEQEDLKFLFGAVAETYTPLSPAGAPGKSMSASWSVMTNSTQLLGGSSPCGNSHIA